MDWELTKVQSGVAIGKISNHAAFPASHSRDVVGLLSGLLRPEYPTGETPIQVNTLINQFMIAKGGF